MKAKSYNFENSFFEGGAVWWALHNSNINIHNREAKTSLKGDIITITIKGTETDFQLFENNVKRFKELNLFSIKP